MPNPAPRTRPAPSTQLGSSRVVTATPDPEVPEQGRDAAALSLTGVALGIASVWLVGAAVGCASYTTPSSGYVRPGEARQADVLVQGQPGRDVEAADAAASAQAASAVPPPPAAVLHGAQANAADVADPSTSASAPAPSPASPAEAVAFTHGSASDTVPVGVRTEAAPASGGSPSAFALYGQIGEASDASFASPMDAQDNLRRVTFTTEGADFDVEIEGGGEHLFFASTRHRETADLYRQRVGGTAVTQLTTDPGNDVMPAVSPDGRRLAFASDRGGTWDLYVMDTDGGQTVKLTDDAAHNIHPSFSPDGTRLVYCSYGSMSGTWELVLIDLAQPTKKRIIGHGLFPVWSPTEDTIVFQRARERGSRWFSVWTVDIVDGEAVSPTEVAVSSNAAVITPEWSPDGQNIVFCTVLDPQGDRAQSHPDRPAEADVWVVNRDGTGRAKLTQGDYANLQPAWSDDGSVYFISDRGLQGVENIWSVRPSQAVRLAADQRPDREPAVREAAVQTDLD